LRVDLRHQDRAERELPGLGPFGQAAQGSGSELAAHDRDHRLSSAVSPPRQIATTRLKLPRQTVTASDLADVSVQSCLMGAPRLADWMRQHPAERLAAWRHPNGFGRTATQHAK